MDARRRIRAGTAAGIACWANGRWQEVVTLIPGQDPCSVFKICPHPDGCLYFGSNDGYLIEFVPEEGNKGDPSGRWSVMLDPETVESTEAIEAICVRSDGTLLTGSDARGILRWDGQTWQQLPGDDAVTSTAFGHGTVPRNV